MSFRKCMRFPSGFHPFRSVVRNFAFGVVAIYGPSFDLMLFCSLQSDQMFTGCVSFLAWGECGFPERDRASEATIPLRRRILASVYEGCR